METVLGLLCVIQLELAVLAIVVAAYLGRTCGGGYAGLPREDDAPDAPDEWRQDLAEVLRYDLEAARKIMREDNE